MSNRPLWAVSCSALALSSITLGVLAVRPGAGEGSASRPDVVEARRFVVRNPDGSIAAEFGLGDEKPSVGLPVVKLYDRGKVRAEVAVSGEHGASIGLIGPRGHEAIRLSTMPEEGRDRASVWIADAEGNPAAEFQADGSGGGHLTMYDAEQRERLQLSVPAKDAGRARPSLTIFGPNGDEVISLPQGR